MNRPHLLVTERSALVGAGKARVRNDISANGDSVLVKVIVADVSEVNIDASLI